MIFFFLVIFCGIWLFCYFLGRRLSLVLGLGVVFGSSRLGLERGFGVRIVSTYWDFMKRRFRGGFRVRFGLIRDECVCVCFVIVLGGGCNVFGRLVR